MAASRRHKHEDLAELMIRLNVTVDMAADRSGGKFARDVIYRARRGERVPHLTTRTALAEALGVTPQQVLDACCESCRRAGNLQAVEWARTGQRPRRR